MILKINFSLIQTEQAKGVRVINDDKKSSPYLILLTNPLNIDEAIEWSRGNKQVALILFEGDISDLCGKDLSNVKVGVKFTFDIFDSENEAKLMEIPQTVRCICKLPEGYSDMRKIFTLSSLCPNVRFCGGNLINIQGCNLGCITLTDLGRKEKQGVRVSSCFCVEKPQDVDGLNLEFVKEKVTPVSQDSKKGARTSKRSLPSFASLGGLDSF